ncbi:MAG TPA: carboxypeptidase regulatory-like domain-containing protein [Kofleriaceae bacterium]|nr:carboxypeptidase regulatory-like domain-containing protein [Kofleriaceae bacterium]
MARTRLHVRSLSPRWLAAGLALAVLAALAIVRCARDRSDDAGEGRLGSGAGGAGGASAAGGADPRAQARGSIAGTVRSESGAPIANAVVCTSVLEDEIASVLARELPCAKTDARGAYVIDGALPGLYKVAAMARGHVPGMHHPGGDPERTVVELGPGARATGIDVVLRAGGAEVTGVITDVTGGPIAQARVEVDSARTETDAAGRYSLWVEPGSVWVSASASGYASASRHGSAPGTLSLALVPESTLSGIVVDTAGAPVAGALVFAEPTGPNGATPPSEVSTVDGRFSIMGATPGTYEVTAWSTRGYGRTDRTTYVGFGAHVSGVTVTLHRAFTITGTVMAEARPCVHAELWVESDHDRDRGFPVHAGAGGVRTIMGLLPGNYRVKAFCDGFAPSLLAQIAVTDRDVVEQIWRVQPGATVRGRVLDRRGAPIVGDSVSLSADGFGHSSERTGADGKFTIGGLLAATYEIEVSHGSGTVKLDSIVVGERAAIERDLVIDDTGAIRGVVADASGRPVGQVRVDASLLGDAHWHEFARVDDDGRFYFDGVTPGEYRISTTPRGADREVTVRAGKTTEVRLELPARTGVIRGTVEGSDGAPIADAFVTTSSGNEGGDVSAFTGQTGAFELRSLLPEGSYWLTAHRAGSGSATVRDVQVGATVKIQLGSVGSIEGTVIGAPDPVKLSISGPTHQSLTLFRTGGRYAFTGLPPGAYTISAAIEGKYTRADVTLAEGEHKRGVDVRVQAKTTITGRMVDARTRAPVADLWVRASEPGDDLVTAAEQPTGADGRFTLRDINPGAWMIYGNLPGVNPLPVCAELRHVIGEHFDAGELPVVPVRPAQLYQLGFELVFSEEQRDPAAWRATVESVEPGGPADKAGLRPGDVITAVNGTDVTGPHLALFYVLAHGAPAGTARVTLARGVTLTIAGTQPRPRE